MFETKKLSREKIERRRLERKANRKYRRRRITLHCCQECGQPKSYICLEHNLNKKKPFIKKILKKIRYNSKKFYFGLAVKFGLAINK